MTTSGTTTAWIRDHKVTWEMSPWQEIADRRSVTVGFELRLLARHTADQHPAPGCHACVSVYEGLRAIARQAFPPGAAASLYEIEPFDASFHLRPEGQWTPEVQLAVHIVHRAGYLRPVDECEKRCVELIKKNLEALGVQPKTWSDARAQERERSSITR